MRPSALSHDDARRLASDLVPLARGPFREGRRPESTPAGQAGPYAPPYYWAAFVLIASPE